MGDWPCIQLLAYLEDPSDDDVGVMMQLVDALKQRQWHPMAPELVNEVDPAAATQPDDEPLWTLGISLQILSPRGAGGVALGQDEDQRQFRQVEDFLRSIGEFSRNSKRTVVISYDENDIGEIAAGRTSKSITKGLLDPWRQAVGLQDGRSN